MNHLEPNKLLDGKRLLLFGGTGFLGKVLLSMLLKHYPNVGHIYLIVRSRKDNDNNVIKSSKQRFLSDIITSEAFDVVRKSMPKEFSRYIEEKITVLDGDVSCEFAGIAKEIRDSIRGKVDVLVNASGVVDFNPPLDRSLEVNAFGMKNLVALAKDLGDIKFMHTSTCYVAGGRTGQVDEVDPLMFPFPKADDLDLKHWDPQREIDECTEMIRNAHNSATNAFRQSEFLSTATENLKKQQAPTRGKALENEVAKVERRYIERLMIKEGTERAQFWGWHNIYTYTKSIGEQILCNSGLPFTIVRPAVIESALSFPKIGWNEGINTSAPLIYLCHQGPLSVPATPDSVLDIIPVDLVSIGMILSLLELLEGTHKRVYQYGSSDSAPLKMFRLIELTSLHKRKHRRENPSNPLLDFIQKRMEALPVSVEQYHASGPAKRASQVRWLRDRFQPLSSGPLRSLIQPAINTLNSTAKGLDITAKIIDQFLPFTATHNYRFSCANTREAFSRLPPEEQQKLLWEPENIDWYHYFINIHCPGLEEHVFPLIEEKKQKGPKALPAYDNLIDLLDEVAERHEHLPAFMQTHPDGFIRYSYKESREMAHTVAKHLFSLGVRPGDRVILSGDNHPYWSIAYFGILCAGAVAVPLDVQLAATQAITIEQSAKPRVAILDSQAQKNFGNDLDIPVHSLNGFFNQQPEVTDIPLPRPKPTDLASILYTSGTTGNPKGVMISHHNFTSLLSSLSRIFPLTDNDRVLSVLPLHHTFEFSCGLLLPLSRGTTIIYISELSGEEISRGLKEGRVTAMVGVPALWQLLERRISSQIAERGKLFDTFIKTALDVNRSLGKTTGLDLGPLLFSAVHQKMGGKIRYLISGGAALPKETHTFFAGLGLHLTEGYGLTEAAPVLTVSSGGPSAKPGTVGKPIPGIEILIKDPDKNGVGEVLARGENVMQGYYNNPVASQKAVDKQGWLHTGDMGKVDAKGRLFLSGRAKEVVVSATGENIYLDDVEQLLGTIDFVKEYVLVGITNPRGGERLGLLGTVDDEQPAANRRTIAMSNVRNAIEKLPMNLRPAIYQLVDADLPRTRTRKIKRKESAEILEKIVRAKPSTTITQTNLSQQIAEAVASVVGVKATAITAETRLREDLAFDSLMAVELAGALAHYRDLEPKQLEKCETVSEIVHLLGRTADSPAKITDKESQPVSIPKWVASPVKQFLGFGQQQLYKSYLKTTVIGRANIPQNRQVLAISNHSSHLDMGLIKYALGDYGKRIVGLAAQDYFFEGNKWKVAYFSQLTNLKPIDRNRGYRTSIKQAKDILDNGNIALIFPEGTRQLDGKISDFKPMFAQLALESNVDILPLYLGGAYDAMPKGSLLPKPQNIEVRIGPPLQIAMVKQALQEQKPSQTIRLVAKISQYIISELKENRFYEPTVQSLQNLVRQLQQAPEKQNGISSVFNILQQKYLPEKAQKNISWYFSLGGKEGPRYTVQINPPSLQIYSGKPTSGKADCVVKTSEELLRKMVMESYVPEMSEFVTGKIKTNSPGLLIEFQKIFNLQEGKA